MREAFPRVSFDNWLEHALPAIGAVCRDAECAFQIAQLVEYEERMITGAFVMAVPYAHLLFVRRAHQMGGAASHLKRPPYGARQQR
jgi:hypothetical protein